MRGGYRLSSQARLFVAREPIPYECGRGNTEGQHTHEDGSLPPSSAAEPQDAGHEGDNHNRTDQLGVHRPAEYGRDLAGDDLTLYCAFHAKRQFGARTPKPRLHGRRRQLIGEQLAHRRKVDQRLPQSPVGANLALAERSASVDHRRDPCLERVLVGAPVTVESLLASDLRSDVGGHGTDRSPRPVAITATQTATQRPTTGRYTTSRAPLLES
jgi:hypothetical protein